MAARFHGAGLGALCLALAGCAPLASPPAPTPPDLGLQQDDRFGAAPADAPAPSGADLHWWRRFDDPALAQWVERALAANLDVAVAQERVQQARALLQSARAQRGLRLAGEAAADLNLQRASGERRLQPSAALTLDYDLDLWGGLRAAEASAEAGVRQQQHLVQAARLGAASLAARGYVEWRLAQNDHRLLAETVAVQRDALRIVQVRVDAGLSPVLDRDRAAAEVAATEAEQAAAAVRIGRAILALQVLAGQRPQLALAAPAAVATAADDAPAQPLDLPDLAGAQPVVRPLDLLRLRPDLQAAEQALLAAAAEVGVAEAALRPRLRLPGVVAFGGSAGAGLLELAAATLSAVLEVSLFDGGARDAAMADAQSRLRESALAYRQTLQVALQQVEEALLAQQGARNRIAARQRAAESARAALAQAQTLYRAGLTNFLDVADAQRSALANQRELLQARADAAAAAVVAFEAMGLVAPAAR